MNKRAVWSENHREALCSRLFTPWDSRLWVKSWSEETSISVSHGFSHISQKDTFLWTLQGSGALQRGGNPDLLSPFHFQGEEGEIHSKKTGLMGFPGGSVVKNPSANAGDPWGRKIPREGNGNALQCSCLENPMGKGAWWPAIYGVTKRRTRLSD